MVKKLLTIGLLLFSFVIHSQNLLFQNFDDITTLGAGGWLTSNQANNVGSTTWFQGNPDVFSSYSGATDSYIGANFNSRTGSGRISTWLFTPVMTGLQNGDIISFYTRTTENPATFPDRLELRISTDATEVMPSGPNNVGSFTLLALSVNSGLTTTDYPGVWTQFTYTISGLSGPTNGRIALRYHVTNGGPSGTNSNYIGIDDFSVDRVLSTDSFFKNNFSLYPNPVNNVLNVVVKNEMTINNLSITDLNGRVVSSSSSVINSIDVSDLSSGVYFISIETNEGKGTAKFVKK